MILKAENKSNFTILSNAVLLDETISDKARGVLVRLLCRPENWNLNIKHLVKTGKTGNAAIRSAIRELEAAGYIRKEITRHENGRIIGVEYTVCECKDDHDQAKAISKPQRANEESIVIEDGPCQVNSIQDDAVIDQPAEEVEPATSTQNNRVLKTVIRQTAKTKSAPIINTDIKQKLRVTTTTPAREAEPEVCDQMITLPSSSSPTHEIINLIPIHHQTPIVLSLVNKAVMEYPEHEVKEAIAYAGANVRGGSMQFKAYLDKTLKNKWADGFFDAMQEPGAYGAGAWFHPRAKYPNGTVTGNRDMDTNCMVAADFLMDMGVDVNKMCAEA